MSLKKFFLGLVVFLGIVSAGTAGFVMFHASAFDASVSKNYGIPELEIRATSDAAALTRGKHLVESVGGCAECHGRDLGGTEGEDLGPVGIVPAPNLTTGKGGIGGRYSDGELARLLRHGLRDTGQSLRFMPAQDISWWPDDDLAAVVSYLRTLPPVDRAVGEVRIGLLGKVLDRFNVITLDVARRIDHSTIRPQTLQAQPTAEYGALLARSCTGCHGEHFSGGKIPGAPSDLPVPANLTPHTTGLAGYNEADWNRLLDTGLKRGGQPLNPFMPIQSLRAMDATERGALWKFLSTLPPRPFGER